MITPQYLKREIQKNKRNLFTLVKFVKKDVNFEFYYFP